MDNVFPDSNIDPRLKDKDWILKFAKAAWSTSSSNLANALFHGRRDMDEVTMYAMGKQSVDKYKRMLTGQDATDKNWLNVDWTPPPIIPKFREIAISKLMQRLFDISVYAVDPLSRTEEDQVWAERRAKLVMRQALEGSEFQNIPSLQIAPGEPEDMEQLQIEMQFGYKHNLAMEAEQGIDLTLQQNKIEKERKKVCEALYDHGIGGYREWIDENGSVKFRAVNPKNLILSFCEKSDFTDASYIGEIKMVMVADLAPYFDPLTLDEITKSVAGKYSNPSSSVLPVSGGLGAFWNKFKVQALDLEFVSYNIYAYKQHIDNKGNIRFGKTEFEDLAKTRNITTDEGAEPKYMQSSRKVVYTTKWIVGTDYMYDYGLSKNMARKPSSWWDTSMSFHLIAWNFDDMQFAGITKRLIPIADNHALTWFKLQNLKNQLIPYIVQLDYDALENIPFGANGKDMSPMEVMDLLFQKFVAIGRSSGIDGKQANGRIVDIVPSGMLQAFEQLYSDLNMNYGLMQQISGFNVVTDGSSINPKMLKSVANLQVDATNSALYMISDAERQVFLDLCDAIVMKMQIAVKLGKVQGWMKPLGESTVKFLEINPDISLREFGLFIDDAPTEQERNELLQEINMKDSQGLLSPADKILIKSCRNLKQAAMLLSYKLEKKQKELQQFELQKIQENNAGSQQAAIASEQMKQQTEQIIGQFKLDQINAQGQWQFITAQLKVNGANSDTSVLSEAKKIAAQIQADASVKKAQISKQLSGG